jgi:hypothetical protein
MQHTCIRCVGLAHERFFKKVWEAFVPRQDIYRLFIRDFLAFCKEVLLRELTEITALVRKLYKAT